MTLDVRQLPPRTKYFIETGTHRGGGISTALEQGYQEIRSVELDPEFYEAAKQHHASNEHVRLYFGDSRLMLAEMIADLTEAVTFWLDAHTSDKPELREKYGNTPILEELDIIEQHPIKNHVIMVDDIDVFGTTEFDRITVDEIHEKLLAINSKYTLVEGGNPNRMLVAYVWTHKTIYHSARTEGR